VKGIIGARTILLLVCFTCHFLYAQNTIGIPNIVNYTKQQYNAGSQNWNIVQDKNGILYCANNDGLLSFDGIFWRNYKLPNKTITRSVAVSADNKIYTGGQGEIGYFSPGTNGELVYTSLNKLIPAKDNDFADVWNICFYQHRVFFRANKKILEYDGKKVVVYNSVNWAFLSAVNGELLAYEIDKGLVLYMPFDNDNIQSGEDFTYCNFYDLKGDYTKDYDKFNSKKSAAAFDGTKTLSTEGFNASFKNLSISAWFNYSDGAGIHTFLGTNWELKPFFDAYVWDNLIGVSIYLPNNFTPIQVWHPYYLSANQWYFMTMVVDDKKVKLYLGMIVFVVRDAFLKNLKA